MNIYIYKELPLFYDTKIFYSNEQTETDTETKLTTLGYWLNGH